MKSMPWIVVVCVTTLAGHVLIQNHSRVKLLEETVKLSEQARKIEHDEVRDLMYALQQEKGNNEAIAMKSFVAGVVDNMKRPDYYNEIWHAGYDRGSENQKYADSIKPEEATTQLGY